MTIETAVFAVQRGDQRFSCKGDQLRSKLADGDILLVNRDGIDYQFVLEQSGKLKIFQHVDFEFNDAGAIVITQNAGATGGDTPYTLTTDFDITISNETVSEPLARIPINAQPMPKAEKIVFAFGITASGVGSTDPQELYQYSALDGEWALLADPQSDPTLLESVNNRYGCSAISHNGHQIIIDQYGSIGTDATRSFFVMHNGTKTKTLPPYSNNFYKHLDPGTHTNCKPISRFFMRNGELHAAIYASGVVRYPDMTYDQDGFPNLDDPNVATGVFVPSVGEPVGLHYMKGAVYDPYSDRLYYSSSTKFVVFDFKENPALVSEKTRVADDNNNSVNIVFTATNVIRTIIRGDGSRGSVQVLNNLSDVGSGGVGNIYSSLVISNLDQTKLFKLKPGDPVKYMNYSSTADPSLESSWTVYRPEPIANTGVIGGAGAIIEEPFLLAWYQDGEMKAWGSIPNSTSEATVTQTITDANGDSVSSSTTKDAS
jgi:hypothetical protein